MYSFCDAIISGLSVLTIIAVIYLIRRAFKKHYLNIFSHMMLILIVFGLVSKFYNLFMLIISFLVRAMFFMTDLPMFLYDPDE